MMRIFKILIFTIVFCISFLVFLPKVNLYYLCEQELKKYDVVIFDEQFKSKLFGFELTNGSLNIKDVNIAILDKVDVSIINGIIIKSKEIGLVNVKLDINTQNIVVDFQPTQTFRQKYKMALKYFKKLKNGDLRYEYELF